MSDQLITDLETALKQVITDETTLQAAITAVQGVVTTPGVDPNDAIVTAVEAALTSAGYTVTAPAPVAPVAPAAPATPAPATPAETESAAEDAAEGSEETVAPVA
jgi:hypothetical protein